MLQEILLNVARTTLMHVGQYLREIWSSHWNQLQFSYLFVFSCTMFAKLSVGILMQIWLKCKLAEEEKLKNIHNSVYSYGNGEEQICTFSTYLAYFIIITFQIIWIKTWRSISETDRSNKIKSPITKTFFQLAH